MPIAGKKAQAHQSSRVAIVPTPRGTRRGPIPISNEMEAPSRSSSTIAPPSRSETFPLLRLIWTRRIDHDPLGRRPSKPSASRIWPNAPNPIQQHETAAQRLVRPQASGASFRCRPLRISEPIPLPLDPRHAIGQSKMQRKTRPLPLGHPEPGRSASRRRTSKRERIARLRVTRQQSDRAGTAETRAGQGR
jgi:hypothetical protein